MNEVATAQEIVFWKTASEDLGIDIVTPFEAALDDGMRLRVAALVKNFGPRKGMLIATDYDVLKPYVQKIIENGYGYSAHIDHFPGGYDRGTMIDVLKDWGWSGAEDGRPSWLD